MGDSTPAKETRLVILGVIGLAVLIVGYCGVKAVQFGRTAYGLARREGASLKSRMDTTFHVHDGSAVYLDNASIAPIAKVVLIHGDTGLTSQNTGAVESTMVAALRSAHRYHVGGVPRGGQIARRYAHDPAAPGGDPAVPDPHTALSNVEPTGTPSPVHGSQPAPAL